MLFFLSCCLTLKKRYIFNKLTNSRFLSSIKIDVNFPWSGPMPKLTYCNIIFFGKVWIAVMKLSLIFTITIESAYKTGFKIIIIAILCLFLSFHFLKLWTIYMKKKTFEQTGCALWKFLMMTKINHFFLQSLDCILKFVTYKHVWWNILSSIPIWV